jgi:hypothetical protein
LIDLLVADCESQGGLKRTNAGSPLLDKLVIGPSLGRSDSGGAVEEIMNRKRKRGWAED